jgi:hypothetical protein
MSIRVTCPGGHSLRVKAEAVGHRVTCPRCGLQFRVAADARQPAVGALGPSLPRARLLSLAAEAVSRLPRAVPLNPHRGSAGAVGRPPPDQRAQGAPPRPATGPVPTPAGPPPSAAAPLAPPAGPNTWETGFDPPRDSGQEAFGEPLPATAAVSARSGPSRSGPRSRRAASRRWLELLVACVMLLVVAAVAAAAWWILDRRGFFKSLSGGRQTSAGLP